jgi:ubiquinone/menaquinone biosynthesis C-methylase UbiE
LVRATVKKVLKRFLPARLQSALTGWRTQRPAPTQTPLAATSGQYRLLSRADALEFSGDAWSRPDVAERQHAAFRPLLQEMYAGRTRADFESTAAAIRNTGLPAPSVLDVGCGSGYYSEVISHLCGQAVSYHGVDVSWEMIRLARRSYPHKTFSLGDARSLPHATASFDIVLNGCSLMHIAQYEAVIAETARVSRHWCIFHTVPIVDGNETIYLRKTAYGGSTVELVFSERELVDLFQQAGLSVQYAVDSIPYDLSAVVGRRTFTKTYLCRKASSRTTGSELCVNIGCGRRYHRDWINLDTVAMGPGVIPYDVTRGIPLPDATGDFLYLGSTLEHFRRSDTHRFLRECHRVLRPGAVIRVTVPDLEAICRLYLQKLESATSGDAAARQDREWMLLELFDQMTRERTGGEMLEYLAQNPLPNEAFVMERIGVEGRELVELVRQGSPEARAAETAPPLVPDQRALEIGRFRLSGEVHHWMYDRFSLAVLLQEAGFCAPVHRRPDESYLSNWAHFGLETLPDGTVIKPDCFAMEATRPTKSH